MASAEGQSQLVTTGVTARRAFLGRPLPGIMVYILIFMVSFMLYTVIVFIVGYKFGSRGNKRVVSVEKVTTDKMTMTPPMYSYVRGVKTEGK